MGMKKGPLVTVLVTLLAFGAVIYAFSSNASPYVTVAQAKTAAGDHLHVAGDIVKDSVRMDPRRHTLTFDMTDAGGTLHVIHVGEPPANLQEAKKVVAVGGMKGNDFISHQLLIKCPSKYEGAQGGSNTKY